VSFRKRGLELLELMRGLDTDDAVHAIQLQRLTGFSRPLVVGAMCWLEDCGAVKLHLDDRGRHCWTVAAEPDEDALFESLVDDDLLAGA
jgi:hypothetical protein